MLGFYFSDIKQKISFNTLQYYHSSWKTFASTHPFLSALIFVSLLSLSVCFIIPDTILLGIIAGFLFPLPLAIFYIALSETIGAYLFYEAIRIAFTTPLHKNKKAFIWSLEKKFQDHQISYLIFFRLSHLLPFWVINTAAACFAVRRWVFIWTCFVGILPLSFILAQGGSGLNTFFETNTRFSLSAIFNDKVKFALVALALLTLIPLLWQLRKK